MATTLAGLAGAGRALREETSDDVYDLLVKGLPSKAFDVALGGDDEIEGTTWSARGDAGSQLGVAPEGLADPALDTVAHDRVADLFGDRDAKSALRAFAREELKDQVARVHTLPLALDAQELPPLQDAARLGEALGSRRACDGSRIVDDGVSHRRRVVDAAIGDGLRRR